MNDNFFASVSKKRKCLFIINVFLLNLFLVGCQSVNHKITSKNSQRNVLKKSSQNEKALVFYASDDPLWLPYFSNAFTRRISDDGIYEAVQNRDLNKEWLSNSIGTIESINLENKFSQFSNKIKEYLKTGNLQKARKVSIVFMKEAALLLSNNPESVSFSYATLAFWSAVANIKFSETQSKSYALIYEKYSSFSLKDALEAQVDVNSVDMLKALTSPLILKQRSVKILNSNNCAVFVDGQELKSSTVKLPAKMQSVLSASCSNGSFSQIFTAEKFSTIRISPYLSSSFYSMPNPSALPKEQILAARPAAVILIYWSHSGKFMESCIIEPKNFSIVKKTRILLSTKKDLDEAGDNLIAFLKSLGTISSKTSPSSLTSSIN
jgi:hypothetical protein